MRKDVLWEPFFVLAFHLKLTNWSEFYSMPIRMRNWLIERTVEEFKKQNELNNKDQLVKDGEEIGDNKIREYKTFKPV